MEYWKDSEEEVEKENDYRNFEDWDDEIFVKDQWGEGGEQSKNDLRQEEKRRENGGDVGAFKCYKTFDRLGKTILKSGVII